jgi:hypothetical protein
MRPHPRKSRRLPCCLYRPSADFGSGQRPSPYYGPRQYASVTDQLRKNSVEQKQTPSAPPLVPNGLNPISGRIDKSQLAIAEPKRLRDKAHLKFVASQPCLICGRQPSDPHHLRFAQPRGIGLKVSDEFTVPLCRGHHRQLHQAGNEVTWWEDHKIKAMEIAKGLWEQTRPLSVPTPVPQEGTGAPEADGTLQVDNATNYT